MCEQFVVGLFLIVSSITYLLPTSFRLNWIQSTRSTNKVSCIRRHIGIGGSGLLFSVGHFISWMAWMAWMELSDP